MQKHLPILFRFFVLFTAFSFLACKDDETVTSDQIISLEVLDVDGAVVNAIVGDGNGRLLLRATLPLDVSEDFSTVTFTTTMGNFTGTDAQSIEERANVDGVSEVSLDIPLDSGEVFLKAEIGKEGDKYNAKKTIVVSAVDEIISLAFKTTEGNSLVTIPRADGTSQFLMEGSVLVNRDELNAITFTTTKGMFFQNSETTLAQGTNNDGLAIATYIVPQETGVVFYSAKTGSDLQYSDDTTITYDRAHAETIFIEPATLTMTETTPNLVSIFLVRSFGNVSLNTGVAIEAYQVVANEEVLVGRFTGLSTAFSDVTGKVNATFHADTGDIDLEVPVTLRASTQTDTGATIQVSIDVRVTE